MGLSMRAPGQGIITFVAEATITDGNVVVQGAADDKCKLPASTADYVVLGLAKIEGGGTVASGSGCDVVTSGVWPAVAAGTIVRGDRVVIANTAGGVKAGNYGVAAARVVGYAMESASSGERVAVLVMPGAMPNLKIEVFTAEGTVTANTAVKVGTGANQVVPATTDLVTGLVGVALHTVTTGLPVAVCTGGVVPVITQGNTTLGANLTVGDTAGGVKVAAPSAGVNAQLIGTAMTAVTAPAVCNVLVNVNMMQGA